MKYWNHICLSIILLFFLVVPLLRELPAGQLSYVHLRVARQYLLSGPLSQDPLYHAPLPITPLYFLLAAFLFFAPNAGVFFSFLLLLSCIALFYLFLNQFHLPQKVVAFSIIFAAISPLSIFAASNIVTVSLSLFFILLGSLFFLRSSLVCSFFFLALAVWQDIFNLFPIIILAACVGQEMEPKQKGLLLSLFLFSFFIHPVNLERYTQQAAPITDFGAMLGLGLFGLLLALLGLYCIYQEEKIYKKACIILCFFAFSWYLLGDIVLLYFSFYFSFLAGWGAFLLTETKWESKLVKQLTLLVLACGLLFSSISYTNRILVEPPSLTLQEAGDWIDKNLPQESIVLSSPSHGFWIEYFGKRKALATPLAGKEGLVNTLFYSKNFEKTSLLLDEQQSEYILIDAEMKRNIWSKEDEGLLFLFRNREKFKKVYDEKGVQIWRVMGLHPKTVGNVYKS